MEEVWKLWKKGIVFGLAAGVVSWILGMFLPIWNLAQIIQAETRDGMFLLAAVLVLVVMPIIWGLIINWLGNRTDAVNEWVNR